MRLATVVAAGLSITAACKAGGGNAGDDVGDQDADPGAPDGRVHPDDQPDAAPTPIDTDPLHGLPTGADAWAAMCAHGYGDAISTAFCAGSQPPALTSLSDLRALLGLTIDPDAAVQPHVRFAFVAHSTALPQRHVSALNPRMFVFTIPHANGTPNASYQVLGFARGEPYVELVANDPAAGTLRFFLLRFHLPCEQTAAGCNHADLYTPSVESGWTGYSMYDDDALKNSTLDCRQCHQPQGPGTPAMLRMQELETPWRHWFYDNDPADAALVDTYLVARPDEPYGGVPSSLVRGSTPEDLRDLLVNNGFAAQPNTFDSAAIKAELAADGTSATWNTIYRRAVRGDEIMVPYWGDPYDPVKLDAAVTAYRAVMDGSLPRAELPDLADVMLDSAEPAMSHRPKHGLDGRAIMRHMCGHCHNSRLDQSISRSSFNVERLDELPHSRLREAIERLRREPDDIKRMPPRRFHTLSDHERDAVITELEWILDTGPGAN